MVEKTIELTGASATSIEEAVSIAVSRAAVTIQNIRRIRVKDIQANVDSSGALSWRVTIDLSFAITDRLHE